MTRVTHVRGSIVSLSSSFGLDGFCGGKVACEVGVVLTHVEQKWMKGFMVMICVSSMFYKHVTQRYKCGYWVGVFIGSDIGLSGLFGSGYSDFKILEAHPNPVQSK